MLLSKDQDLNLQKHEYMLAQNENTILYQV